MAEIMVTQKDDGNERDVGADWEEESYREGCAHAREQARGRLEELDGELLERKPASWSVLGFRERTMVTRFGEVVVRRRLYRDERGLGRFGLDEHLGWKPRQQSSPSLTESIVALASEAPFRKTVSTLTAGVLSTTTVYRLLEGVGERAIREEHSRWESCFERGEDVSEGEERADVLYTEADGVWVHLQGEDRTHYEVKSGVVCRGWRRTGEDRYELVGKRVYSHSLPRTRYGGSQVIPFWEGASLEWARQYALDRVKMVVVGGDGANWIRGASSTLHLLYTSWTGSIWPVHVVRAMAARSEQRSMRRYVPGLLRVSVRRSPQRRLPRPRGHTGPGPMWSPTWSME